tara:strand:+ start:416 stop:1012 length:597 start_codon:yes stop_codon:yes gene_type:complete
MKYKTSEFEHYKAEQIKKIQNRKKYPKLFERNAAKKTIYGGRRFLGFTPKGKDIWVSMKYDKLKKELILNTSIGFEELFNERAKLATSRVDVKLNEKIPDNLHLLAQMNSNRKNAGGQVSYITLEYIQKLVSIVDSKNSIAFIKGQPTSLLFQYVASTVYPGDLDELRGFRWMDVVKIWELPRGPYFTIDSFAKTVDN